MKKVLFILVAMFTVFTFQARSQSNFPKSLETNTRYLSNYDMKGRGHGSQQAKQTKEFIKNQMQSLGLQCVDYTLNSNQIKQIKDSIEDYRRQIEQQLEEGSTSVDTSKQSTATDDALKGNDKLYENFYVTLKAQNKNIRKGSFIIEIPYNGYGVDTLQEKELVNYSVNNASKVALAIEMAKYFKEHADSLCRDITILFIDDIQTNNIGDVFRFENKKDDIKMVFSFGNITDECYKTSQADNSWWSYTIPYNITNAGVLLVPVLMKDLQNYTQVDYDGQMAYRAHISYTGNYDSEGYTNIIDSLDFNTLNRNLSFAEKVIMLYANNDLSMKVVKTKDGKMIEDDNYEKNYFITEDTPDIMKDYKHRSYWGMNAMIGSNTHHYTKGRVTGKNTTAFMVGLFAHLEFAKYNSIRIGVNYERANANRKDGWYQSNVLSIPLNYELSTGGKHFAEFSIAIGPYFDYTFSGELNKKDLDFDDEFRDYEFGLNLQVLMRTKRFIIGWYMKNGFTNIMHHDPEILERASYFMLGWRF